MADQDEDRAAQRAAILQRRARLVACAVMTGVLAAPSACSKRCLSPIGPEPGAGGVAGASLNACLSGAGGNDGVASTNSGGAAAGSIITVEPGMGGEEAGGSGGATTGAGGEGGGDLRLCLSVK
jgi:hypothetical protein